MQTNKADRPWILVRGAGDLATGTILRLHRCGFKVLALECADPSAIRRKAAFCEAVWQGSTTVEGAVCRRIERAEEAAAVSAAGEIPLLVDETCAAANILHPAAVVDAILAKRNLGTHRAMAPITVGLGPGFTAGQDVDAVVETMRGHKLGRVILEGAAIPNTGVPGNIGGYTAERVIHAPAAGPMEFVPDETGTLIDIGAVVRKGQCIGRVGGVEVLATLDGVLRGIIRQGYPVTKGLKIADIDPRMEQVANCDTVSDKARAIAGGVVEALLFLAEERASRCSSKCSTFPGQSHPPSTQGAKKASSFCRAPTRQSKPCRVSAAAACRPAANNFSSSAWLNSRRMFFCGKGHRAAASSAQKHNSSTPTGVRGAAAQAGCRAYRWTTSSTGRPSAESPTTMRARVVSAGSTGSSGRWSFRGSRWAPSASQTI